MTFRFEFTLGEDEQVRASRAIVFRRRGIRIVMVVCALLLVASVPIYMRALSTHQSELWLLSTVLGGAGGGGLVGAYMAPRATVKSLRKNNRAAAGPNVYELSESGLHATALGASTTAEWPNIVEAHENAEFLFLYVSATWAILLPKRIIGDDELPRVRAALRQWVGERAHIGGA